ncbi:D-2-hydroxyacid dehydrogenase family protein [Rugosimonospora africana]|uniref:2-hydroxyacid dehydrogenase n=1 Tax=Rugosimonospora africana TaxID=556532 RepID=A0A8J3VSX4_9ACTN|nr:D-2-hydroxyacid dehydrogenase family protein [Rugosimonospora africana]GIH17484.1 2-hydroxyacid dehydrogenase [Rugosimonospora africana]
MTVRVAVLDDYQDVSRTFADWGSLGDQAELTVFTDHVDDTAVLVERLAGFDVVVAMRERTPFPAVVLDRLPRLRLLITTGMANAAIDLAAAERRGVTVCGTSSLPTGTAELTWGLILALLRHIPDESRRVQSGGWQATVGRDLSGSTLGVIGLGRMGVQVAKVGQAFGMDVVAWSQNLRPEQAAAMGARAVTRDELLSGSDVVTIHLKLSERTRGLIGEAELRSMRPDAYLINTSRGPIVDEAALLTALREGWIAGAGLDVFDAEPLPADHPLRTAPNTVLTPHLGYVTRGTYQRFFGEAVEDIAAFLKGQPVRVL